MTHTSHTPGPWIHRVDDFVDGSKYLITDSDGDAVAVASPLVDKEGVSRGDFPERDANARLISAAPQLLGALMAILAEAKTISYHAPFMKDFWNDARAAIAEATGRPA